MSCIRSSTGFVDATVEDTKESSEESFEIVDAETTSEVRQKMSDKVENSDTSMVTSETNQNGAIPKVKKSTEKHESSAFNFLTSSGVTISCCAADSAREICSIFNDKDKSRACFKGNLP